MITSVLVSFAVMLIVILVMAVGVIFGRQPIKGSCGGLGAVGVEADCKICGGDPGKCDEFSGGKTNQIDNFDLAHDAAADKKR